MTLKERLDMESEIISDMIKDMKTRKKNVELTSMLIIDKDGKKIVIGLCIDREDKKAIIERVSAIHPQYLTFITEAYMRTAQEIPQNYRHGQMEEEFKSGSKDVKEVIVIQVYSKTGKLSRVLDKETLKSINEDCEDFAGFMTVSDVQRIFWEEEK
jgi:hypothetical protein